MSFRCCVHSAFAIHDSPFGSIAFLSMIWRLCNTGQVATTGYLSESFFLLKKFKNKKFKIIYFCATNLWRRLMRFSLPGALWPSHFLFTFSFLCVCTLRHYAHCFLSILLFLKVYIKTIITEINLMSLTFCMLPWSVSKTWYWNVSSQRPFVLFWLILPTPCPPSPIPCSDFLIFIPGDEFCPVLELHINGIIASCALKRIIPLCVLYFISPFSTKVLFCRFFYAAIVWANSSSSLLRSSPMCAFIKPSYSFPKDWLRSAALRNIPILVSFFFFQTF